MQRRSLMGDSVRRSPSSSKVALPYLGSDLPMNLDLSRRDVLKLAGYTSVAAFLAACGTTATNTTGGSTGGTVHFGSNQSDAGPKKGYQAVVEVFSGQNGGPKVKGH